ncbi:MAG: metal-dependent transcriptional regulator, partial [Promethearchaeota archaeon]
PTKNPPEHASKEQNQGIPSASIEEYLEAVFRLLETNQERYAKTGELAELLKVAPASVTQMIQKLAARKYLVYRKGRGVRLTQKGREVALDVLRRHRVAELLLVDLLGVSWEEAHEVACRWEHILTKEMCDRILERLGEPATCPHGNPIPNGEGRIVQVETEALADLREGDEAVIDCISNENPDLLRIMASMGMLPGEQVKVLQIAPRGDTLLIEVGTAQFALSRSLATQIKVRREPK